MSKGENCPVYKPLQDAIFEQSVGGLLRKLSGMSESGFDSGDGR